MSKKLTGDEMMEEKFTLPDTVGFDKEKNAKDKFVSLCPELMAFSGKKDIPGEAKYTISIHSDIDVDTSMFDSIIENLPRTTYVFVALGNDER